MLLPVMCGKYRRLQYDLCSLSPGWEWMNDSFRLLPCPLPAVVHRACSSHCTVSAMSEEASIGMLSLYAGIVWSGLRCQELSIEGSVLHFPCIRCCMASASASVLFGLRRSEESICSASVDENQYVHTVHGHIQAIIFRSTYRGSHGDRRSIAVHGSYIIKSHTESSTNRLRNWLRAGKIPLSPAQAALVHALCSFLSGSRSVLS
ncbi:hypothetical protein VTN31DRAFT_6890 [Thermomyces dupontii]|uniref:uncharacterized protein n=1 Tax=Talaromyces thermophilus TaxID=28565 RepID=UPI003744AE47